MLDIAINYTEELEKKFHSIWFKDRYKFHANANFYEEFTLSESTWTNHQFVSLSGGEIIGYIGYGTDRVADFAYGLSVVNFEDKPSVKFAMDLGKALTDIFKKYNFRKLCLSVVVGNPIEKSYDKMCKRYSGRIVGIQKDHTRLIDGKFYDEKLYEILREDYYGINKRI